MYRIVRLLNVCIMSGVVAAAVSLPLSAQSPDENAGVRKSMVTLWGGYTGVELSDVNNNLVVISGPGGSGAKMSSGFIIAGDYLFAAAPRLMLGPRIEYVGVMRGKALTAAQIETTVDLYLVNLMLGGRYYLMDRASPWNISGGVFAGVALGYGKTRTGAIATNYTGQAFAADAMLGSELRMSETVSLALDLGYRFANVPSMNTDGASDGNGGGGGGYAPQRVTVTDASGNTLKYDFSGMIATIGINFKF